MCLSVCWPLPSPLPFLQIVEAISNIRDTWDGPAEVDQPLYQGNPNFIAVPSGEVVLGLQVCYADILGKLLIQSAFATHSSGKDMMYTSMVKRLAVSALNFCSSMLAIYSQK